MEFGVDVGVIESKAISNISKFNKMRPDTLLKIMIACKDLRDALIRNQPTIDKIYQQDKKLTSGGGRGTGARGGGGKKSKGEKITSMEKSCIERKAQMKERDFQVKFQAMRNQVSDSVLTTIDEINADRKPMDVGVPVMVAVCNFYLQKRVTSCNTIYSGYFGEYHKAD